MSSDETPNVPAARNSRDAVREKAQQVHAQQSRARTMRRLIIALVAIVAVGSIGAAVAYAVSSSMSEPTLSPSGMSGDGVTVTEVALADGSGTTPSPEPSASEAGTASPTPDPTATAAAAPVDIHVYVDYLSTGAAEFERANARQLATWIGQDAVTVTYHPVALLTASSNGTKYSLRAASAAACVATYSPKQFYDYNHELLADQPEIDSDGRTNVQLADLAVAVGVENAKTVRECIEDQSFVKWAKDATARALEGPLPGSKDLKLNNEALVVVDGKAYVGAMDDPAEFSQFVLTTASDAYFGATQPTPTPTPVPTASATPAPKS